MAQKVQKIACSNNAGFVMSFTVAYIDEDGNTLTYGDSGNYPINQTRTIDLKGSGIAPGTFIWPIVNAVWGLTQEAHRKVRYSEDGNVATYDVSGTTLNYNITLNE
jgi:hypothetical protein